MVIPVSDSAALGLSDFRYRTLQEVHFHTGLMEN